MPEGPFGLPRLTALGPFVEDELTEEEAKEKLMEMKLQGHSYRNYQPEDFLRLVKAGVDKGELRELLDFMEAGRWKQSLDELHGFFVRLDEDEAETFAERNPGIIEWLEVWAILEDQRTPSEILDREVTRSGTMF